MKGVMKFNFADDSKYALACSGTIPLLKFFQPGSKTVTVLIGGVDKTFTLNAHGQGSAGASKIKLSGKMKKGMFTATPAKFTLSIRGEPLLSAVAQYGFANATTSKSGDRHSVSVIISVDQTGYENAPSMLYKATAGKSGTAVVK